MHSLILNLRRRILYRQDQPVACLQDPQRRCGLWCPQMSVRFEKSIPDYWRSQPERVRVECPHMPAPQFVLIEA